ncbi:MAG TPA: YraN family protein [Thiohalobacter sp.]|nr:YraN family protein [Thiohalobacter sp.]
MLRYLQQRGLKLVSRNYHCRAGEIDLIMLDGASLAFIEVRYRRSTRFGHGFDTIDRRKRRHIIRSAAHFLLTHPRLAGYAPRFDVVGVHGELAGGAQVDWLPNAFSADDG